MITRIFRFFCFCYVSLIAYGIDTVYSQTTVNFNYTGGSQTWTVPACVYSINVTVKGSKGGGSFAGNGATVTGTLNVTPGQVLQINVGGSGNCPGAGGFNGGGSGAAANTTANGGCGGGGASDIRVTPYGMANRLIVAAGGGGMGGGDTDAQAGHGGCASGGAGNSPFGVGGSGATSSAGGSGGPPWISSGYYGQNGALGNGGNGATDPCYNKGPGGGGGGGYYGGGGGGSDCYNNVPLGGGGGGGGSSLTPAGGTCTQGNNTGTGTVSITYNGVATAGTVSVAPTSICAGQTTTLSVTGHNGTIQWQSSTNGGSTWNNISGATNSSYTSQALTTNTCFRVAISCGSTVYSNMICINVTQAPIATATPALQTICTGVSTAISLSSNVANTTFSWTVSQLSTTGAANGNGNTISQTLTAIGTNPGTATYTITPTAGGCTGLPITVTVTVQPKPTITLTPLPSAICPGGSTTITASGASTYNWNNGLGAGTTQVVSPAATTTYTVTATNSYSCSNTSSVVITVHTNPSVTISPANTAVCAGQAASLTAAGANTYSWNTGQYQASISVSPPTTTTYTVIGTSNVGCSGSAQIVVSVNNLPNANAGNNVSICSGHSTQLNATGGVSYLWTPANGLSNTGIFNPVASPTVTTTYVVRVTDAGGCSATDDVVVNVYTLPPANAGTDQIICVGQSANLTAFGGVSYAWSNSSQTQSINVSPSVTTTYTVTVTDNNGCSATDNAVVFVNPLPPANAGANAAICIGSSTQLNASGGLSYTWSPSTGLSSTTIANPIANPSVTTSYIVTVTDNNGCSKTDDVLVSVNSLPPSSAGTNQSICFGNSTQLGATGGVNYVWSPSTGLSSTSIANPNANPTVTTTYTLTVTDINGCSATSNMVLTVNPLPIANAGNDSSICSGNNTLLTATGGISYSWSPVIGLSNSLIYNPVANPVTTTNYSVTVTDANGCSATDDLLLTVMSLPPADAGINTAICYGNSTQLNASGGISYLWSPTSNMNFSNVYNPVVNPLVTTTYNVTVTDSNGCSASDAMVLTINPLPPANAGNNTAVCNGFSTQLTATGGTSYIWDTGALTASITVTPTSNTTYTVTVTDQNNCSEIAAVVVQIHSPPNANAGGDIQICLGHQGNLNASGGVNYQWSPTSGLSSATISNPMASPPVSTTYTVTVTDANGCSATDDVSVGIYPDPQISFSADIYNGCSPLLVQFTDNTIPIPVSWSWNFGDAYSSSNTSSTQNPTHQYTEPGVYTVMLTVTTTEGCVKSLTYNNLIHLYPNPQAAFSLNPTSATVENPIVQFTNLSAGATSWFWNFDDPASSQNNFSTLHSPSHTYNNEGDYEVVMIALSQFGCADTAYGSLKILPEYSIYIPSAFTPNNDGLNDFFKGFGNAIDEYAMYIYTRWGELVFESNDYNKPWDGRSMHNNTPLIQDVYVYKIIVKDFKGKTYSYVGRVALL
ncbi:MAG: PKD domain-containing protein [Bacteroidales bacterium]|nr:PKD domain-containing protein [Bacteroidales bacterium]